MKLSSRIEKLKKSMKNLTMLKNTSIVRFKIPTQSVLFVCGYHPGLILHCAMNIENKLGAGIIKLQPAAIV